MLRSASLFVVLGSVLLGVSCSKDDDGASAPAICQQYLDCLSMVEPDMFDEEVEVYGDGGSCVDGSTAESCANACETGLANYEHLLECGAEPGAQAPPGKWGGLCLAPDGECAVGTCNTDKNYCYTPDDPCLGFTCGGEERGTCTPVGGQPSCACNDGFENETFELYCCPEEGNGSDPDCVF